MIPASPGDADAVRDPTGYLGGRARAWAMLALLFLLMAFDFIDRQVLSALLPLIKPEWGLSDAELGLLIAAVNIAIAVLGLPVGFVMDRWSRTKAIGIMAVVWSAATGACAFAGSYAHLLAARFFVGAGEAGYSSGGNALLATIFPERLRATVIGIFLSAAALGSIVGVVAGGVIGAHWGWRHAFGIVAIPGLLLALLVFFTRDYATARVDAPGPGAWQAIAQFARSVLGVPALWLLFAAQGVQQFFVGAMVNWLPSYFNRFYGLDLQQAGARTGILILATAAGLALSGYVADRLFGIAPRRRILASAVYALLCGLFNVAAFSLGAGPSQYGLLLCGSLFASAVVAPAMSAVTDLVHLGMRATSLAALNVSSNLIGYALGPLVGGVLSDHFNLQAALQLVAFFPIIGSFIALAAARAVRPRPAADPGALHA
ncbi:MAG: hypothetical protein OJF60_000325 [Burkholderiaceae bacterium]|jgi:MFS family permease|nr:MAG: hypothetical protein OJF60_000325 [Burkholderiaceae bacterium]